MDSTPQIHQPTSWGRTSTVEITHTHEKSKNKTQSIEVILVQQQAFALDGGSQIPTKFGARKQMGISFQYIFNRLLAFFDIFDVVCKMLGNVSRWASHGSNSQPITIKAISVWYHDSGEFPSVPTSSCVQYSRWRSRKDISAHLATLALSATGKEWFL